jgi:hypothetical protein
MNNSLRKVRDSAREATEAQAQKNLESRVRVPVLFVRVEADCFVSGCT